MVDVGGLVFSALVVVLAIPFAIMEVRHRHGVERNLAIVGLAAAVLFAVVTAAESLGWLRNGPLYWTLRISLGVLFWALAFQVVRRRRGNMRGTA